MNNNRSAQRIVVLMLLAIFIADAWWLITAVFDNLQKLDLPRLLIGLVLQGFGVWALISKAKNSGLGRHIPGLLAIACLFFGAAGIWYGLLHGGESRVSPSIWKQN
jgi:thiol:disulfide interchange protein